MLTNLNDRSAIFYKSSQVMTWVDDVDNVPGYFRKTSESFMSFTNATETANKQKTKLMGSTSGRVPNISQNYMIDNFNFEAVDKFIYLGSLVTASNNTSEGIMRRTFLANILAFVCQRYFFFWS